MNLKELIKSHLKNVVRVKSIQPIGLKNNKPKVPVGSKGVIKHKFFPLKKNGRITINFDDYGLITIIYNPKSPAVKEI